MTTLEDFLRFVDGGWHGDGVSFETPWSPAGAATTQVDWSALKPSATTLLRHTHRHDSGPRYESVTVIVPAEPARAWTFDSFNFVSETPGPVRFGADGLVLERTSPRGTNRTRFALADNGAVLVTEVHFLPPGPDAAAMPVARATLRRVAEASPDGHTPRWPRS